MSPLADRVERLVGSVTVAVTREASIYHTLPPVRREGPRNHAAGTGPTGRASGFSVAMSVPNA